MQIAGESVYGEKRVSVELPVVDGESKKIEYRIWNPFRSKLAASILAGIDNIHIKPGAKVLYLGAASGTSVSHVSDIVGPDGSVFAVEFSHRSGEQALPCHLVSQCHQGKNAGSRSIGIELASSLHISASYYAAEQAKLHQRLLIQ